MLAMFILYYDNYEYGNQSEAFVGYKKNWSWTWSKTDRFYNENWISDNFGQNANKTSGNSKKKKWKKYKK